MKIENLIEKSKNCIAFQKTDKGYTIKTEATFLNGKEIDLRLEERSGKVFLTDNKSTLKYMNDLYELSSTDVKMCISNVLKIYGFSISGGTLLAEIPNENTFMDKFFDFIMCIGQLSNMFAFFDKP